MLYLKIEVIVLNWNKLLSNNFRIANKIKLNF